MRICVLAEPDQWHWLDLKRAAAGKIHLESRSFNWLAAAVDGQDHCLETDFDLVLARAMPAGSLQQIIFRMDVLLGLERRGLKIVNPPRAIEAAVDKYLALSLMEDQGVPVPETRVSQSLDQALVQFRQFSGHVVSKPLFGTMGQGLVLLESERQAKKHFVDQLAEGNVIYQQEFIDHGGMDLRLLVIGKRVFGMKRTHPGHWITNVAQGATGEPYQPTSAESQLAIGAAGAVGASIAGVDLVRDPATGRTCVLEVNSSPSWRAIGKILEIDFASEILDWLKSSVL